MYLGTFAGQLGDGAAMYLGEVINSNNIRWELHLKGAGKTPFSRFGDGRKSFSSSLREFLCCEAMYHLNIETTRAATCIISDTKIERYHDGIPIMVPCGIISRLAPTFLRFGSFEITQKIDEYAGPSFGNNEILQTMINFTIKAYFPEINILEITPIEKYKHFYKTVAIRTAKLVAKWQSVGFVHGVLNTDNMSILGLTIDYGPFGFMNHFDFDYTPNISDEIKRYRYRKQPDICRWNLQKFAEALKHLVPIDELLNLLSVYDNTYINEYVNLMIRKFGLKNVAESIQEYGIVSDIELINKFLETLENVGGDYTNCFRELNLLSIPGLPNFEESLDKLKAVLLEQSSNLEEMKLFLQNYFSLSIALNDEDKEFVVKKAQRYINLMVFKIFILLKKK